MSKEQKLDKSRRDFMKSLKNIGVGGAALFLGASSANAFNDFTVASGYCGNGSNCSGGGGLCGTGYNCGGS